MRRRPALAALIGAIVFLDALFYAVLAPLLPHYAAAAGVGSSGAGLLVASYPAGVMFGAIPAGWLTARAGARAATLAGLLVLAAASVAFGLAGTVVALDASRFAQGLGSAAAWTGGLAWLTAATPAGSRGAAIGAVLGAAVAGTIAGPALGVGAAAVGAVPVFLAVAAVAAALALAVALQPGSGRAPRHPRLRNLDRRVLAAGLVLICVVGLFIGLVDVLVPLRLHRLDASTALIGATFLLTAALQSAASPLLGRVVDRRGGGPVAILGLAAATVLAALAPWPQQAVVLAAIVVVSGPTVGGLWVPGMALLGAAGRGDGANAFAFAIGTFSWSAAQMLGSATSGPLSQLGGDALPFLAFAALAGLVLLCSRPLAQVAAVTSTSVP